MTTGIADGLIEMAKTTPPVQPSLVIFDLFGTLIKYGVMHHPFRQLLKWARENGRQPKPDDALRLMTINGNIPELATALGISAPDWLIDQMQLQIREELNSLTLYEDVTPTLALLKARDIPIAICSNLASPYGEVLHRLLGEYRHIRCMSYEVGFIKPEPEIFRAVIAAAQVRPEACLFVGDTSLADYDGPRRFGMDARHLIRDKPANGDVINSLTDLLGENVFG